jgi:hypothetical protein
MSTATTLAHVRPVIAMSVRSDFCSVEPQCITLGAEHSILSQVDQMDLQEASLGDSADTPLESRSWPHWYTAIGISAARKSTPALPCPALPPPSRTNAAKPVAEDRGARPPAAFGYRRLRVMGAGSDRSAEQGWRTHSAQITAAPQRDGGGSVRSGNAAGNAAAGAGPPGVIAGERCASSGQLAQAM